MMVPTVFWGVIICATLSIFLLSLREVVVLSRLPHGHPERPLYWFNACFLLCASACIYAGGVYLDVPRRQFAQITPLPDGVVYAHERNSLVRRDEWVFMTEHTKEEIFAFHRAETSLTASNIIEDGERMMMELPSGPLFLTVLDLGSKRELHYSRVGSASVAIE